MFLIREIRYNHSHFFSRALELKGSD